MTRDERDAEVGRLVRERRDLREEREALLSKARDVRALLDDLQQVDKRLSEVEGHLKEFGV